MCSVHFDFPKYFIIILAFHNLFSRKFNLTENYRVVNDIMSKLTNLPVIVMVLGTPGDIISVYKVFRRLLSLNFFCIYTYLTIYSFAVNRYFISKLLYTIITHNQNKTLYNKELCITNFTDLMMFLHIYRTHAKFNNSNEVV